MNSRRRVNSDVIPLRFLKTINVQRSLVIRLDGTSEESRAFVLANAAAVVGWHL
jgi:hypothetical protein